MFRIKKVISKLAHKFRRWLNTPPSEDDLFFVRLRQTKQYIWPCRHVWEKSFKNNTTRKCSICTKTQTLTYSRFGRVRFAWTPCKKFIEPTLKHCQIEETETEAAESIMRLNSAINLCDHKSHNSNPCAYQKGHNGHCSWEAISHPCTCAHCN